MRIINTKDELRHYLGSPEITTKTIGFVPTMGALHDGHLSLVADARSHSDIVVCSIFVNPTQFNDPTDLEKYPRPIEQDIALLKKAKCDILFMPTVDEIYSQDDTPWHINLGGLDKIWEGKHRPGHFQGVTQVVHKLFELVQPDIAFFGQKDFQQVMVIQQMIIKKNHPVKLFISPTIRNTDGLALSSRNTRLSLKGLQQASTIYKALQYIQIHFGKQNHITLEEEAKRIITAQKDFSIEYLAICEASTLQPARTIDSGKQYVVLAAVWLEGVRLIDNMVLNPE